ncbi:MAG: anti-FecI sigma factor, FecR [Bacteroidetes bacterium]|jgi:ferric-dicitrate binding protein FerR (iron transport regulator)|nr:anti-FecI sigma factor, FecR [Bacteroidota bacterium]
MNIQELIVKFVSGNTSSEEQRELEMWRQQGDNEKTFQEMKNAWEITGSAHKKFSPDVEGAWKRFEVSRNKKTTRRRGVVFSLSAAAVLIPLMLFFIFRKEEIIAIPQQTQKIVAQVPENIVMEEISTLDSMVVLTLPDSSRIWLNRNSKISYPENFIAGTRTIHLEGEAYFEVRRMEEVPFVIYTQESVTRVLGTSFNLKAYDPENVEVTVISGSVEFAPKDDPALGKVILSADEKGMLIKNTTVATKEKNADKENTWWKKSKRQNKFKKFLNKIKRIFKKQ